MLEVAAESDFLVVCSQLTAETRGFIDAAVFAAMKPGAVLINVARGEEVDEDALVEAVTAGGSAAPCSTSTPVSSPACCCGRNWSSCPRSC